MATEFHVHIAVLMIDGTQLDIYPLGMEANAPAAAHLPTVNLLFQPEVHYEAILTGPVLSPPPPPSAPSTSPQPQPSPAVFHPSLPSTNPSDTQLGPLNPTASSTAPIPVHMAGSSLSLLTTAAPASLPPSTSNAEAAAAFAVACAATLPPVGAESPLHGLTSDQLLGIMQINCRAACQAMEKQKGYLDTRGKHPRCKLCGTALKTFHGQAQHLVLEGGPNLVQDSYLRSLRAAGLDGWEWEQAKCVCAARLLGAKLSDVVFDGNKEECSVREKKEVCKGRLR